MSYFKKIRTIVILRNLIEKIQPITGHSTNSETAKLSYSTSLDGLCIKVPLDMNPIKTQID